MCSLYHIKPSEIVTLALILSASAAGFLFPASRNPPTSTRKIDRAVAPVTPVLLKDISLNSEVGEVTSPPSEEEATKETTTALRTQRRRLGSQELLMLPRQYPARPHVHFPQMNHVAVFMLSATPSVSDLRGAVNEAIRVHPLLRAHVEGTGHPEAYKDLMQMVRRGNPDPCTFVAPPTESAGVQADDDTLTVFDVPSTDRADLDESWKRRFLMDVDDPGEWCDPEKGPLWKMELHRLRGVNGEIEDGDDVRMNLPCALVVTSNHVISDQGSLNVVIDQILSDLSCIEENGRVIRPALVQPMPVALEDSVLGLGRRWSDIHTRGMSLDTITYLTGKTWEFLKAPVLLPDAEGRKEDGGGILAGAEIIAGMTPGGLDERSSERRTTMQYRTLSTEATAALLRKCRSKRVAMSSALAAAVAVTAANFVDGGVPKPRKSRNYKVLQSLDMRKFGAKIDGGRTLSCQAGSMDLMLGPVPDRLGERIRSGGLPDNKCDLDMFWDIAEECFAQTSSFIKASMPEEAVRVFDAGMTISEMNQLVHMEAKSKASQGRAYSAGITNAGVYGRQPAIGREGVEDAGNIKDRHGRFQILDIFYATSHARTGCLFPVSCLTVRGRVQCSFNPPSPLVSAETNKQFADAFIDLLETVARE